MWSRITLLVLTGLLVVVLAVSMTGGIGFAQSQSYANNGIGNGPDPGGDPNCNPNANDNDTDAPIPC